MSPDYAYELGYDSPFDPSYSYSSNVIKGWQYLLWAASTQTLTLQDHIGGASGMMDDPDTNGNGIGIHWGNYIYSQGICLMALVASGTPDRENECGIDFNGDGNPDTYNEITQDAVDWLAFAQGDLGTDQGGYDYGAISNVFRGTGVYGPCNSNSGYAYLGLASAESPIVRPGATPFACIVPDWVKIELNEWIDTIQDPVDGDDNDGGSWYRPNYGPPYVAVNELKTGNLIFEMTFYGNRPDDDRFVDAMDFIARQWQHTNIAYGWGYTCDPAMYQAMFCLMKGLEYSGIATIDLSSIGGSADHDWYEEFATVLVNQQDADGGWPKDNYQSRILSTCWALLTLEKIPELYPSNQPPVADAGPDQTVEQTSYAGADVTLDGSGSYDPDNDPLTYDWTWTGGSATGVNPTVTFPLGTTTVTLTVSDGTLTDTDTVDITIIDTTPPVITCPADVTVEQESYEGTVVPLTATATDICDPDPVITSNELPIYPLGTTIVTFTATDISGNSASCSMAVTVVDTTPPEIAQIGDPIDLWPPNHKYHTIEISDCVTSVTDICDPNVNIDDIIITSVSSDEPEDVTGNGDGHTYDDIVIVDAQTVKLRSERQGAGNGRVYTINYKVTDMSGNTATGTCKVWVRHDQSGDPAIDDGADAGYTVLYP